MVRLMEFPVSIIYYAVLSVILFAPPILYFFYERKKTGILNFGWINFSIAWFVIMGLIIAIQTPCLLNARRTAYENRCKLTLRALAATQQALLEMHGKYLPFNKNVNDEYISSEYTFDNTIDKYRIVLYDVVNDKETHSFTIVAIPKTQRTRLRTFAICQDETARVWIGQTEKWETGKAMLNVRSFWEPLR